MCETGSFVALVPARLKTWLDSVSVSCVTYEGPDLPGSCSGDGTIELFIEDEAGSCDGTPLP